MSQDKAAPKIDLGRLKVRVEGSHWVARYEVKPGSDLWLGSIAMGLVTDGRNARQRRLDFLRVMSDCANDLIEGVLGVRSTMGAPQVAPEHEKGGNA